MVESTIIALKNVELNNEAEDSDEIPAYTELPLTNNKIKEINITKYAARRVAKLFISHLLDTDIVKIHSTLEKHFVVKNFTFRNVMIRGTIVGLQFLSFKTKDRMLISVDDGTGVMDCYVEENEFLERTRNDVYTNLQNSKEMFEAMQSNNVILQASLMLLQSSTERISRLPNYKHFQLGEMVELIGTLSEYHGKRSCFVVSILKSSVTNNVHYLEHLHNFYRRMIFTL